MMSMLWLFLRHAPIAHARRGQCGGIAGQTASANGFTRGEWVGGSREKRENKKERNGVFRNKNDESPIDTTVGFGGARKQYPLIV